MLISPRDRNNNRETLKQTDGDGALDRETELLTGRHSGRWRQSSRQGEADRWTDRLRQSSRQGDRQTDGDRALDRETDRWRQNRL